MKILVTGASGFVGRVLCCQLRQLGNAVVPVVRRLSARGNSSAGLLVRDIGPSTQWAEALDGIEVVIHLAARVHVMRESSFDPLSEFRKVNVVGTERMARAAVAQGVKRFVYVSSIGVHGKNSDVAPFTEQQETAPYSPYTVSKLEAERALIDVAKQTGMELTIVRPPLVYGPDNPGNFLRLLRLVELGLPLPLGSVDNRRSMIYVANLADALSICATHADAAGRTYLVSDGEDCSTPQLIRSLAQLMGVPARLWRCPPALLRAVGKVTGMSDELNALIGSLVVDSSRIRHELGWIPPFTLEQGLQETARWFRGRQR